MKLKAIFISWLLLLIVFIPSAGAHDDEACNVATLFEGWARSSPAGAPNGAVFGLLVNLSEEADTLISARTDAAEVVELHETIMGEGDVMQMRPVEGGLEIAPQGYLELTPGGLHIMLINLTQPLVAGGSFDLLLNFEHLGEISVTIPIVDMVEGENATMMQSETTPTLATDWPETCEKIHVVGAWARPAVPGMPNSAAYALLVNLMDTEDTLISAVTDVAEVVELHEMLMGEGDVMQMRPVEGGIRIPAGGIAFLKPGGLHVMLIGLTQELPADSTVDLTLTFAENEDITLTVPVRDPLDAVTPMPQGS